VPGDTSDALTEAAWTEAQGRVKRLKYGIAVVGAVLLPLMSWPAAMLAHATANGTARYPVTAAWDVLLLLPFVYAILRISIGQQAKTDGMIGAMTRRLSIAVDRAGREAAGRDVQLSRQEFESRLANALDMAEGEPEVIDAIERSFGSILPESPVELLLADNSHAHMLRMAATAPTGAPPGCGVDSPHQCPAARRAQVQRYSHSEDLDACPKLRGRANGPVSASCVPVSIMGRTVGVIHATGAPDAPIPEAKVHDLAMLSKLAGARIGLLRVIAETELQAATDGLTGLLNRRSFERKVSLLRRDGKVLSLGMSDLDHFKTLNDTYGHETGDRALRLYAQVLAESVRGQDLVCRHGGEEFAIALPGCPLDKARLVLDAVRNRLDTAITVAGLPKFTVSFGVVAAEERESLSALISRADAALFEAKSDGRNRVAVHAVDAVGAVGAPVAGGVTGEGVAPAVP